MVKYSKLNKVKVLCAISKNESIERGKPCPRCGSTNTDKQNSIWYCYDCQKEF